MAKIFVSGITGSLGTEVTRQLLAQTIGHEITGYSRDELRQQRFTKYRQVTLVLGDIRDRDRLLEATRGMDIIYHFAALKHVDLLEQNPEESIRTNVEGTENILHAQRINKIKRVVLSSTDKAVEPINVYGFCKALAEKLVLRNDNNVVCRYGNVLASNGSVIPKFVKDLKTKKCVYITHKEMNRFFITLKDAAGFVISSAQGPAGLHIPKMKAANIKDVSNVVASILKIRKYHRIYTGMRAGEKINECLESCNDPINAGKGIYTDSGNDFTKEELFKLLKPIVESLL